jgi:hypothetical protein
MRESYQKEIPFGTYGFFRIIGAVLGSDPVAAADEARRAARDEANTNVDIAAQTDLNKLPLNRHYPSDDVNLNP